MIVYKRIIDHVEYTVTFLSDGYVEIRYKDFIGSFGIIFKVENNRLLVPNYLTPDNIPQNIIEHTNKLLKLKAFL